jgi:uncharacterized protein YbjQ (UPF0145 family)
MRTILLSLALFTLMSTAVARDTRVDVTLQEVIEFGIAEGKLDGSVQFYLSGAPTPTVVRRLGEGTSNRKTNAANKSDQDACRWAALSALVAFQNSAKAKGANAVVELVSYYKKNTWVDAQKVECHAGAIMAGVALKGSYAEVTR